MKIMAISEKAVKVKDDLGRTPLHWLAFSGGVTPESLQVLVDKCPDLLLITNNNGRIPLHAALEGYFVSHTSTLAHYHQTVTCLLESCPSGVHVRDNEGMTPLDFACEKNVAP